MKENRPFFAVECFDQAQVLIRLNDIPRAYDFLKKSLDYDPDLGRSWRALCVVELKLGKYYDAIESAKKALQYDEYPGYSNIQVWYTLGTAYLKTRKFEKAIENYQKVIKADPKNDDALVNMAFAYEMLKDYEKEIECCKKVLKLNPKDADALYKDVARG